MENSHSYSLKICNYHVTVELVITDDLSCIVISSLGGSQQGRESRKTLSCSVMGNKKLVNRWGTSLECSC